MIYSILTKHQYIILNTLVLVTCFSFYQPSSGLCLLYAMLLYAMAVEIFTGSSSASGKRKYRIGISWLSGIGPSRVDSWRLPLAFLITLEIVRTGDSVSEFSELLRGVPSETNGAQVNIMTCHITSDKLQEPLITKQIQKSFIRTLHEKCFSQLTYVLQYQQFSMSLFDKFSDEFGICVKQHQHGFLISCIKYTKNTWK